MMDRRDVMLTGLAALMTGRAVAQPVQEMEGPTVFESGSKYYHTAELRLPFPGPEGVPMADHLIHIAWPRGDVPDGGFPALHLMDGHAVAALMDETLLAQLAQNGGPAIVAHGHDRPERFATLERAFAYTPPAQDGSLQPDPRGRPGGGADRYLSQLTTEILPQIEAIAPLNAGKRLLWGHSFAGLFVLQAALFRAAPFARFVAASPSLWWDYASYYDRCRTRIAQGITPAPHLDLHSGSLERERASRPDNANAQKLVQMRDAVPEGALDQLEADLRGAQIDGERLIFEGASHGETFGLSVKRVLTGHLI